MSYDTLELLQKSYDTSVLNHSSLKEYRDNKT